jgi:hypothetical protein
VKMAPKGGRSGPSPQRRLAAEGQLVVAAGTGGRGGWVEALHQSSGTVRDGQGGAGEGCLWWLSDDEHNDVQSDTGAVNWQRKKKKGAPRWCARFIATGGGGRWRRKRWAGTTGGNGGQKWRVNPWM